MSTHPARLAALALVLSTLGCRSAFAPEPVLRLTTHTVNVPATTSREVVVRTGPSAGAPAVATLPAGAALEAGEAVTRGFRRVRTADGKAGFVEAAALAEAPAAAATAAPAAPSADVAPAAPQG